MSKEKILMSESISRNVVVAAKKDEKGELKSALKSVMFEEPKEDKFMSMFSHSKVTGPNLNLAKGPNDEILL